MRNNEHFDDLDINAFGNGGLGGAGAEAHARTSARPVKEGVKVSCNCDSCGAPNLFIIAWPEAIILSTGRLPKGWKVDQGYIRPELGCVRCNKVLGAGVTPSESGRWVKAGINARFVNPQQAQALANQAMRG